MKNWSPKSSLAGLSLFEELQAAKRRLVANKLILDKKDTHQYPIINPPFEIPNDWYWCYLSDVSIIQEGPGIRKHQYAKSGIQFLTVTNILEGSVDINNSKKFVSLSEYNSTYKHYTINKGDIVTACSGGSWGKSAIFEEDEKLILNTSTLRLRFFDDLGLNKYLYYLTKMQYFKESLSQYTTGQQPNYGYYHYSRIPIPLPPLPEQKRIVEILDKAFAAIDKAIANTEKNLQNTKELFESYLQRVFEEKGEDWKEKRLEEIANVFGGYSFKSKDFKSSGKYQVLRMGNIRPGIIRNEESPVFIDTAEESVLKKALLKKNDVVITQTGTKKKRDYGFTVIIDKDNYLVNQRIAAIRFSENYLSKFFLYYSWTNYFKDQYFANETGTVGQGNVGIGAVTDAVVPYCSIKEQRRVTFDIDTILFNVKKIEIIYQRKLADLGELKKSVLQKAFNGELTENTLITA